MSDSSPSPYPFASADMQTGGGKKRKVKRAASPKRKAASPKKAAAAAAAPKRLTIKDRIKAGAKVHVGARGGLYIMFDGKKHPLC